MRNGGIHFNGLTLSLCTVSLRVHHGAMCCSLLVWLMMSLARWFVEPVTQMAEKFLIHWILTACCQHSLHHKVATRNFSYLSLSHQNHDELWCSWLYFHFHILNVASLTCCFAFLLAPLLILLLPLLALVHADILSMQTITWLVTCNYWPAIDWWQTAIITAALQAS